MKNTVVLLSFTAYWGGNVKDRWEGNEELPEMRDTWDSDQGDLGVSANRQFGEVNRRNPWSPRRNPWGRDTFQQPNPPYRVYHTNSPGRGWTVGQIATSILCLSWC